MSFSLLVTNNKFNVLFLLNTIDKLELPVDKGREDK